MTETEVLRAFEISVDETVLESWPAHLREKVIVDLVNGIEVTNDHIKVSKSRTDKLSRCIDMVSGTGKVRQDLINQNLAKGLESTSKWLQSHDSQIASVNMSVSAIGKKLLETRKGVMKLKNKQSDIVESIAYLTTVVDNKSASLLQYVKDVDYRTRAESQLNREHTKWKAGQLNYVPPFLRLYSFLDNLRNSDFGFFLIYGINNKDKIDLTEHLKHLSQVQLARDLSISIEEFRSKRFRFSLNEMMTALNEKRESSLLSINYLSDWSIKELHPSTWLVHQLTNKTIFQTLSEDSLLPNSVRIDRWCDRLIQENIVLKNEGSYFNAR